MEKKWMKRLVSLAVALEMCLSPLTPAMAAQVMDAASEDGSRGSAFVDSERVERPGDQGDQTPSLGQDAPADAPADVPSDEASSAQLPAQTEGEAAPPADEDRRAEESAQLLDITGHVADYSFGIPLDAAYGYPTRYNGYFRWEWTKPSTRAWGYRVHDYGAEEKYFVYDSASGNYYTRIPDMGRLPDLMREGVYVLGEKTAVWNAGSNFSSADPQIVKTWVYDDRWTGAVRLEEVDGAEAAKVSFDPENEADARDANAVTAKLTSQQMQSLTEAGIVQGDMVYQMVPLVARWVPSDNNNITYLSAVAHEEEAAGGRDVPITHVYTEDPTGKHAPAKLELSTISATTFDDTTEAQRTFWIRVPEEQESLTLELEAFEPYYTYNVEEDGAGQSPVSVRVMFNNRTVTGEDDQPITVHRGWWDAQKGQYTNAIYPSPTEYPPNSGYYLPVNTAAQPARSRWTVANIPLAKVAEATNADNARTTVTISVDAPNGQRARYIIYVERLMTPDYELGLGNTPLAMIEKDQRGNWGSTAEERRRNKDAAKAYFSEYHTLGRPAGPGDYVYYKDRFDNRAWDGLVWEDSKEGYNIDLDETAIVVYQDTDFADPGVAFIGSNGKKVDFGDKAPEDYKTSVRRTIELAAADKLSVDVYGAESTRCWYAQREEGGQTVPYLTTDPAEAGQILRNADGSDAVDLRGLHVLPGVYTITYTYTDPLAPDSPLEAKRPMVVLPIPGDVDMDGAVTVADALVLTARQSQWESENTTDLNLLRHRVLGNKTAKDILAGFQPVLASYGETDYFYPPLPTPENGGSRYDRRTWDKVTMDGSATLELRYLGVEQSVLMGEELHSVPGAQGRMGPWQADASAGESGRVTLRKTGVGGAPEYGTPQNDIFWMGVYLKPGDLAGSTLEELTLTLTYDYDFVRPAVVYGYGDYQSDESQNARWYSALFNYNFGAGSKVDNEPMTLFSGYATSDYTYRSGTTWGRDYATHYSKVIGQLEQIKGSGATSGLREMVISVQSTGALGSRQVTLPGAGEAVCVMVVPFQLVKHPSVSRLETDVDEEGNELTTSRLVELGAGMRDFNLVTKAASGSARGLSAADAFGRLFAAYSGAESRAVSQGDTTYAFSAQDSIYGGVTQNLREKVGYAVDSGVIPVGENLTAAVELPEATYDEEYRYYNANMVSGSITKGTLPDGLTYSSTTGIIRGTPTEVGDGRYTFIITRNNVEYSYTLPVNKREIRYSPVGCGSYYGETMYRGEHSPDFRFTYNVDDIAQRDLPEGGREALTGEGTELAELLGDGYSPPTFTARTSRDSISQVVGVNSPVRADYPIVLDENTGLDDKYILTLDTTNQNAQTLQIHPRPVWIDYITADAETSGAQIYSDGSELNCTISLQETASTGSLIHLTLREGAVVNGMYGGRPITGEARVAGDTLKLTFSGEFQRIQADKDHSDARNVFHLTRGAEDRPISNITISERARVQFNQDNPNYTLVQVSGNGVLQAEKNEVYGTVLRREITELEMSTYPTALRQNGSVIYGQTVGLQDLRIRIYRNGQADSDHPYDDFTYEYNGDMAKSLDIHYNWVTQEQMELGQLPKNVDTIIGSGWDPTAPEGEQDQLPYRDTNGFLDCSLDGYYLCAIARRYEENDPDATQGDHTYVKCYSAYPIHVRKKEITLTLLGMTRFYGEEGAEAKYTYAVNELSTIDRNKLQVLYPNQKLTGSAGELEAVLADDEGFVKPTIQSMKSYRKPTGPNDPDIVTVETGATTTTYYQIIYGGQSSNYTFRYARVGNDPSSLDFGSAYLTIMRRPIVVEDVWSMYATGDDHKDTFATIYADSRNLLLTDQVDDGVHTAFAASAAPDARFKVTFTVPDYDAATQTLTYYSAGNSDASRQTGIVYSGDPVLAKDLDELGVTYNVQFLPDQEHFSWNTFSQNYYNVEALTETGGQAQRPVELRDLRLTGEKAGNYMLVYNDSFQAVQRAPANAQLYNAPKATTSADVGNVAYMAYGTGLVILRPIRTMDIKTVGDMSYTYGEYFAPNNPGASGHQFTLSVNYDTRFDNYPSAYAGDPYHNVSSESVVYAYEADTSSFEKRGFVIHYIDTATQTREAVAAAGDQVLMGGDALYPSVHNGKHLFVSGKRGDHDPMVCSSVTAEPLKILPAELTLTARDVHRYYGEQNADGYVIPQAFDQEDSVKPFTFTLSAGQLARWDRERLSALLGRTVDPVDTLTQMELEEALKLAAESDDPDDQVWAADFGYVAPAITTTANAASPVNTKDGRWGEYEIANNARPFANYSVTGVGATLYVYPRPLRITGVTNSASQPVYTVYNRTDGTVFNTGLGQDRVSVERANAALGTEGYTCVLAGNTAAMLKLSGNAMVGDDALTYKAVVEYLEPPVLPEGETDKTMPVTVTIARDGLASSSGDVQRNYALTSEFFAEGTGAVKLRTIGDIYILEKPKQQYTYGDTLDLSGLRVRVIYMMLGDESVIADRVDVRYEDQNQFQSYGLYVNYWDNTYDAIPADAGDSFYKAVPTAYRKAATGDHLTIAPTHDTQQYLGSDMSKPLQRPFAANGSGLIISAFQEGLKQTAPRPKIVAAQSTAVAEAGISSYELTQENTSPFQLSVSPLRLQYTLSATDKTYNGDKKTAGTIRLTNIFDRGGVQITTTAVPGSTVQNPVRGTVTDVVYIPVGAAYESVANPQRYTSYPAGSGYQVVGGAISFTTGSYTHRVTDLMEQNDTVAWAQGYAWDKDLLEFTFPNANVHYEDDAFAGGLPGVGTAELAQYWRATQDANSVATRWDTFPDIVQMPVEVHNMNLVGPDAANYTWAPSSEPQKHETELTLDSDPAGLGANQASLPYATIYKANRQPIAQLLAAKGMTLPTLQVDQHSNVIRMTYGEDLAKVDDLTNAAVQNPYEREDGMVLNDAGVDDFHDELHFEYALAYQGEDGLLAQWAGRDGTQSYQDTLFFGGEVYLPENDADFVPDVDNFEKAEDANEQTIYKGQRYRWAEEDTGLSQRGYQEDSGFYIDPTAYPGYAAYPQTIREAYWFYDLYNTDRAPLPRDTVFYPLVRLAETHNYNPSAALTGDGDGDGAPDLDAGALYEAQMAVLAYRLGQDADGAEDLLAAAAAKSEAIFADSGAMADAAGAQAADKVALEAAMAGNFPEEPPTQPEPIPAVKTFQQRLDVVSATWEQGEAGGDHLIRIVEDIRFTDTLSYPEQTLMDAVVYNNPKRYYSYAWDPDMSAPIRFGDGEMPIDFDSVMTAEVHQRQADGSVLDLIWTYDPVLTNHTAQIYVSLSGGGAGKVRAIRIIPSVVFARLGDKPIRLQTVTDPQFPLNRRYTWTTSDSAVATVDQNGLLTIRGVGTCVITVTTTNGRSDSITVVVSEVAPVSPAENPLFNFYYTDGWANLDSDYAFRPHEAMTRGDVVRLLDLFLNPQRSYTDPRELAYVDVTGRERYYGALARLTRVGVVVGVPGSAFAGERLATRAEFVTMLARMLELDTPDTVGLAHAFADSGQEDTWAYAYIDAMAKAGVIRGTGGGNFAPGRPITREEAAAIIARLAICQVDPNRTDLRVPSDMTPENWSYPAVLRAVNSVVAPEI